MAQRTCLQTQLSKQHLDAAMKDWVVVYRDDWQTCSVGPTHYTPALGKEADVLFPTTEWPFDHAMVETSLTPPHPHAVLAKQSSAWHLKPLRMHLLGRGKVGDHAESARGDTERAGSPESTERSNASARDSARRTGGNYTNAAALLPQNALKSPASALRTANNFLQITLITVAMGALEIDDRRLLFFFASTMTLVFTFGIFALNLQTNFALAGASLWIEARRSRHARSSEAPRVRSLSSCGQSVARWPSSPLRLRC